MGEVKKVGLIFIACLGALWAYDKFIKKTA